jgi:hypothetical protein
LEDVRVHVAGKICCVHDLSSASHYSIQAGIGSDKGLGTPENPPNLPLVAFVKPIGGNNNEDPGYASLLHGQK